MICEQGQASEWALLRRHSSEELFGVQICGAYPDTVARIVELIDQECTVDFIDINMGCPIDIVVNKGAGSALLTKPTRMKSILQAASGTIDRPITVKVLSNISYNFNFCLMPNKMVNFLKRKVSSEDPSVYVVFR